jgi:hypothetical protein
MGSSLIRCLLPERALYHWFESQSIRDSVRRGLRAAAKTCVRDETNDLNHAHDLVGFAAVINTHHARR